MKVDYYNIEDLLLEEERIARDSVSKFVDDNIIPIIEEYNREGKFPMHLIPRIGELGMLGANLHGYGCAGMNNVSYGLIMQELERGDGSIRSFASVQSSLVMYPIYTFGSEEQKDYWLPRLAKGKAIGCFGLTEPNHGSDIARMETRAIKDGDSYIINGSKIWITNGSIADLAVVWAKTDEGVRGFIVEKGRDGFSTRDIKGKFSMRAGVTSELIFEDCKIPKENILPDAKGLKAPLMCLNQARYGIAWGAIGSAIACYETALKYSIERIQFNKPIASFQLVQKKLVDMLTEITKAQLLVLRLGRLKDEGKAIYSQISMAKRNNVMEALKIARTAREILGAYGVSDEYPVIRHMCNLESVHTYEGTYDIHTLIIGRDITGIGAFE
jgi:glutaryl-CoA dehydrogenase